MRIRSFILLAGACVASLFLFGCAQKPQARIEDILPRKVSPRLDPFATQNSGNPDATIVQNPK